MCMLAESTGFYLKWVHVCFQTLINLLQTEGASFANSEEANRMQVHVIFCPPLTFFLFHVAVSYTHLTLPTMPDV